MLEALGIIIAALGFLVFVCVLGRAFDAAPPARDDGEQPWDRSNTA